MAGPKSSSKNKPNKSGIETLGEDIRSGSFRRVYLLYGNEDYLVRQYRKKLISAAVSEDDTMNLNIHREESPDWGQLQDEILSMPFFAERRVVVLEDTKLFRSRAKKKAGDGNASGAANAPGNAAADTAANTSADAASDAAENAGEDPDDDMDDSSSALSAQMAEFLPRIPESTVVIFIERPDEKKAGGEKKKSSVDKRGKLYKAVEKNGLAVEFGLQDDSVLKRWVLRELGSHKIRITEGALERFFEMTGSQMLHIETETQKLISYIGDGGEVRVQDVEDLTCEIVEGKVFRMLELMANHNLRGALELYYDLLQIREPEPKILFLITQQFDRLMSVRDLLDQGAGVNRIAAVLGIADWQARRYAAQARGFTPKALRAAVEECAKMQQLTQSGRIDKQLAVELLIIKCIQAGT